MKSVKLIVTLKCWYLC